jgi:hypothetical protein
MRKGKRKGGKCERERMRKKLYRENLSWKDKNT